MADSVSATLGLQMSYRSPAKFAAPEPIGGRRLDAHGAPSNGRTAL